MKTPACLPIAVFRGIVQAAEKTYPEECCGMVVGKPEDFLTTARIIPVKNVQNLYHEQEPRNFPRTAHSAYFMDPHALLEIQKELRVSEEKIGVFYHSHPDAAARFSPEDKKAALMNGEPVYPDVDYLVVSVAQGKAEEWRLFRWDEKRKDFLERSRS